MSKIITLKDGSTIIYPRTISKQIVGDRKEMGDVQGFIDSLVPAVESPYKYYTVRIDLNNPDPETSCTYMDDAVGMTPGYDGWKDTNLISGIRPCEMGNSGQILGYYTNKEDMSQGYIQTLAPLLIDTDTMIEFPLMGYKLWNDDLYQYVSVTDDPNAEDKGYCYYAHSLNTEKDCDKIYIGAFLGYLESVRNTLHSTAINEVGGSVTPTANTSLVDFRTSAANRGSGYSLISFFPWTLLQCLYVIMYKNLNSQVALGQGYTSASVADVTGTTLSQPFCYGDPNDGTKHVKFLGIEDMWGNLGHWLDGVYCDSSWNILTDYRNSQFTGSDHNFQFSTPTGATSNYGGYINKIIGTNTTGFVKDYNNNTNGTSSTYFADYDSVYSGRFAGYAGGYWNDDSYAGTFQLHLYYSASNSYSDLGARLMYKHLASSGGGAVTPEPQGYKLTLLDYNGDQVAELNNVTNISKAIESSGLNLNVTNNVWLNLKYDGVEDESGNEITEISQDTTAYVRYENIGMNKDEAGENIVCVTIAWDNGINTFAPDLGQSYIYDRFNSCVSIPLIKYLRTILGLDDNSWVTYSTTGQNYGNNGPTAVEFYIDKDDATNVYQNHLLIQMSTESNNTVLINSDLYIVTPKEHNITTIFLRKFNYEWKEEQIHYICNKSDLQPAINYNGNPGPC